MATKLSSFMSLYNLKYVSFFVNHPISFRNLWFWLLYYLEYLFSIHINSSFILIFLWPHQLICLPSFYCIEDLHRFSFFNFFIWFVIDAHFLFSLIFVIILPQGMLFRLWNIGVSIAVILVILTVKLRCFLFFRQIDSSYYLLFISISYIFFKSLGIYF